MRINIFTNNKIDKQGAVFLAVAFLLGAVFFIYSFFESKPIEINEAIEKTAVFDYYELQYGKGEKLLGAWLFFENGEKEYIHGECVNHALISNLENLQKDSEIHLLINPKTNYVVGLQTDFTELLNFDYAQECLKQKGNEFLFSAVSMLVVCCFFVYKAVTLKEQ